MSTTLNIAELLNLVGLSTGVVLYAMLLAMVIRAARTPGLKSRFDPLLLVTSLLGLVWNLCALPAYELPKVGIEGPFPYLVAVGFGALGFLPAVVVHSVLRGEGQAVRGLSKRSLATVAYTVSALAAVLHLNAAWTEAAVPAALGMRLLTYTFIALVVPLAAVTRGQPGSRRALWAAALAIFAVSALHLSQLHQGDASWPVELVGHHASLPLAFAILYQDYPFALADLFLKRALALLAIVAVAFAAIATFGFQSAAFAEFVRIDPRQVGIMVTLWVATALFYPVIRKVTAWFVDTIVLLRPDYPSLRATIARTAQASDDISTLLSDACVLLSPALSAPFVTWRELPPGGQDEALGPAVIGGTEATAIVKAAAGDALPGPAATIVTVPTTDPPRFVVAIGQLTGGRRLLSDDLATLEAIAVIIARRIDAIRITNERYQRGIREQEIGKLATEAELRALRAQINPHFLFNALTTIGYLIQTAPPRALHTLLRLTALLRAVLRSEGEFTTLGRELDVVEAYLDIERARFEQRLRVTIDVPARLRNIRLPPLILQPLVENAVKHGIAQKQSGGEVVIRATVDRADHHARRLTLVVEDTGAGSTPEALQRGRSTGVGLRNVERRLECQYGEAASLSIRTTPGQGTVVEIRMPVGRQTAEAPDVQQVAM
ncbi:MAG TPA: histidine kinase [Vicinamibacterales bacterium]|nr:histidine kinase [Vicinamibacterales bacterium]